MPPVKPANLTHILDVLASLVDRGDREGLPEAVDALAGLVPADCVALLRVSPESFQANVLACSCDRMGLSEGGARLHDSRLIQRVLSRAGKGSFDMSERETAGLPDCGGDLKTFLVSKAESKGPGEDAVLVAFAGRREKKSFTDRETEVFDAAVRFLQILARYWHLAGYLKDHISSDHDPATGLPLYTAFHDAIEREISRARRDDKGHLTIVLLAVQHEGAEGPELNVETIQEPLQQASGFLKDQFREFDTLARYGIFGFSVLLPGLAGEDGLSVTNRVMADLRNFLASWAPSLQLSVRAGISSYPRDATNAEKLIEKGEAALQQAKEGGLQSAVRWQGK